MNLHQATQRAREIRDLSRQIYKQRRLKLDDRQRDRMDADIEDEVFGLGPIEPLMQDPTISDILVNNARKLPADRR